MIKIPNELLRVAYRDSGGEPAWRREDALRVIAWAREAGVEMSGGEIWLATNPGPTIPMYTFDFREEDATELVRNFEWAKGDGENWGKTPYFNFSFHTKVDWGRESVECKP